MCDTMVIVRPDGVVFAKNSDRDANEAQILEWQPRRSHPAGSTVDCTYLTIRQNRETNAVLLSRPYWMWGAEMGANDHGVVIGNEAVFTRGRAQPVGLTGMDLVRLALERAAGAEAAVAVITSLLEAHGQGGGCDHETRRLRYDNSYIVADAQRAFILESAGRRWAVEEVRGRRTISNALSLPGFASEHSDRLYTAVACGRQRQTRTSELVRPEDGARALMTVLRDHGPGGPEIPYRAFNGSLASVCMHGGGLVASSVTTASWVSDLRPGIARHWATGTAGPCCALFKPVAVDEPLDLGRRPVDRDDGESLWVTPFFHMARNPEWWSRPTFIGFP